MFRHISLKCEKDQPITQQMIKQLLKHRGYLIFHLAHQQISIFIY